MWRPKISSHILISVNKYHQIFLFNIVQCLLQPKIQDIKFSMSKSCLSYKSLKAASPKTAPFHSITSLRSFQSLETSLIPSEPKKPTKHSSKKEKKGTKKKNTVRLQKQKNRSYVKSQRKSGENRAGESRRTSNIFPDPFIGGIVEPPINISAKRRAGAIALRNTI